MKQIFMWFFGVIGVIILVYVLIVVIRTVFSYGLNTANTVANDTTAQNTISSTTESVTATVRNFSLANWLQNFHPFQYGPMNVAPATSSPTYDGSGYGHTAQGSYVQDLLEGFGDDHPDFDARWGGGNTSNTYDSNATGFFGSRGASEMPSDSKYIKAYLDENASIKNYQTITGFAYYQVFVDKTFPVYVADKNGQVLGKVKAFANGDIKSTGFVPFRAVLDFKQSTTKSGYIMFKNENVNDVGFKAVTVVPVYFRNISVSPSMPELLFPSPRTQTNTNNNACAIAGCSMQLCVDANVLNQVVTTCEYRAHYACYKNAICERSPETGKCGWRVDNQLAICLQNNP